MDPQTPAPPDPATAADALSTEEVGKFRAFLNRLSGTAAEPTSPPATTATDPPITDAELQELIASVEPGTEPAEPGVEPVAPEPAMASLSDDDRQTLDLAVQSNLRYGASQIATRLDGYVSAGVPPALVNGARAILVGDGVTLSDEQKAIAIDFANGREPTPVKALFATLDAAKGTIDFSERGSDFARIDSEDDKMKQMQAEADAIVARYV